MKLRRGLFSFTRSMLIATALLVIALPAIAGGPKPLWPGARYTDRDRDAAVERGLRFIDHIASDPKHFSIWGHDLLWVFYTISTTSKNEHLREMARQLGQEHARQWLQQNTQIPVDDPVALVNFVNGVNTSERLLGVHDEALRQRVEETAAAYSAFDFLVFDPKVEPPPRDIPESCPKCNPRNPRVSDACRECQGSAVFRDPYDVWLDALITAYDGQRYGVKLGASYPEVLRCISAMRPYPSGSKLKANEDEFNNVTYAITHVIYTLDDYGTYQLSPALLPQEFRYLKNNLRLAIKFQDGEILGEFLDSLRAFGKDESDRGIRAGVDYLLSHQNPDGSWGAMDQDDEDDIYTRYHSTWTAVDGLREYSYREERSRLPEALAATQESKSRKNAH